MRLQGRGRLKQHFNCTVSMRANGANAHMVTWLVFPPAVSVSASLHGRVLDQPVEQAGPPPRALGRIYYSSVYYVTATVAPRRPYPALPFHLFLTRPPPAQRWRRAGADRYGPQETGSFWLPVLPASPHTAGPQRCSQPGNQINKLGGGPA